MAATAAKEALPGSLQRRVSQGTRTDWLAFSSRVAALAQVIEEARILLQEDGSADTGGFRSFGGSGLSRLEAPLSATERKKRTQRLLKSLRAAEHQLHPICSRLERLHDTLLAREDVIAKLDSSAADMQATLRHLHAVEAEKQQVQAEAQSLQEKADAASQEAKKLQQVLTEGAAEYKSAITRANEAHSHMQSLLADNAALRQQAEEATVQLGSARDRVERARQSSGRHQQGLAKLTADNVVLVLRLRQCEAGLAAATAERDTLKLEISEKRGPWFEEVKAQVAERVSDTLARASDLEAQLEQAHDACKQVEQAAEADRQQMHAMLAGFEGRVAMLTSQLHDAQELASSSAHRASNAEEQMQLAAQHQDKAAAECKVLLAENQSLQEEAHLSKVAKEEAEKQLTETEQRLANLEQEISRLQVKIDEDAAALSREKQINKQIMQRKQETEWQLMAALSQTGSSLHAAAI